ncbi:MAG: amidohydrolase [Acidobacteriota bacterium]
MRIVSKLAVSPSDFFPSVAFLLVVLGLAACAPPAVEVEPADLVLRGGKIVTVDEANPEVEALAARDGVIIALGTSAEIEAYVGEGTEVVDLAGQLAVPGFIEGHGHFMSLGDARIQLDLRQATTWQDIVDQVAAAAAAAAPGEWIRGRGWHQDKWQAAPEPNVEGFPVHAGLSAVSPDNPVLLTHASGHAAFANAKAMELAGVDASTPDPPGGEILKDADGQPMGLFRETAEELLHAARSRDSQASDSESRKKAKLASDECLAKGVTSFQDAGSSFAEVEFLRGYAEEGELGVRLWMMIRASNEELAEKMAAAKTRAVGDSHFAVGGIKLSIDGALGSRGAWLLEPYTDSPESTGLNLVPVDVARETADLAIEHGVQLCIHAIGDRANREVLDLYEEVFAAYPDKTGLRWRVEHAQHLHLEDIPRFVDLGVIASMQTVHCTSDGPWVPDRLGDQRTEEGAYVWQKLMGSGAVVMNGTDVPVEDIDPLANFHSAVTRQMPDGSIFYGEQRMTRMEALEATTLSAAYGAFEEELKGSLEVGKLADITVLSKDILTVPEDEIRTTDVVYTIVGGQIAYRADG